MSIMLSPEQTAHLLERIVYDRVRQCFNAGSLNQVEEDLAVDLARMRGVTDELMLEASQALIARALRQLADERVHGGGDDRELRTRYLNAICHAALE